MDIETAEAVDVLRSDIREVNRKVTSLTAEVVRVETALRSDMRELHEDGKRHTTVITESLRADIQLLAEGFALLSLKIDSRRE